MEKQLNEWQKLAEEFYERLKKKGKTVEEYIRELYSFVREKNLDPFDASAITLIVTGSEPLSKEIIEIKKKKLREEVV